MNVNFNKVRFEEVNGEFTTLSVAELLGSLLWKNAKELPESELGRKIWASRIEFGKGGKIVSEGAEVELSEKEVDILHEYIPKFFETYNSRKAIINLLNTEEK